MRDKGLPSLLVRADAGMRIGTGHLMRCLALAQAWRASGGTVVFLGQCRSSSLCTRIQLAGIDFIPLDDPWPHSTDLDLTLSKLGEMSEACPRRPWLVLDGYHFDPAYQEAVRAAGHRVLVIDDTCDRPCYHADVLLNQNADAGALPYHCDQDTLLLLGTRYVLLRHEFLTWRNWQRTFPDLASKVLVTLGGGDAGNATQAVLKELLHVDVPGFEAVAVVGASNPHHDNLERVLRETPLHVRLEHDVADMAALMAWADVAVSAAGITGWELAYMGLPSILLVLADNQRSVADSLGEARAAVNLGSWAGAGMGRFADELTALCRDRTRRQELSRNGQGLVDGMGVHRVVTIMDALDDRVLEEGRFQVRLANPQDMMAIWRLANDPGVRANSFNPEPIPLDHHIRWYSDRLSSPSSRTWVLELAGVMVAQVRYDLIGQDTAEVHFSVVPAFRGKGLGTRILDLTGRSACRELGVKRVRGIVMSRNTPSMRAFQKAGFSLVSEVQRQGHPCSIFEWECA